MFDEPVSDWSASDRPGMSLRVPAGFALDGDQSLVALQSSYTSAAGESSTVHEVLGGPAADSLVEVLRRQFEGESLALVSEQLELALGSAPLGLSPVTVSRAYAWEDGSSSSLVVLVVPVGDAQREELGRAMRSFDDDGIAAEVAFSMVAQDLLGAWQEANAGAELPVVDLTDYCRELDGLAVEEEVDGLVGADLEVAPLLAPDVA